jgi:hypothetical protein
MAIQLTKASGNHSVNEKIWACSSIGNYAVGAEAIAYFQTASRQEQAKNHGFFKRTITKIIKWSKSWLFNSKQL